MAPLEPGGLVFTLSSDEHDPAAVYYEGRAVGGFCAAEDKGAVLRGVCVLPPVVRGPVTFVRVAVSGVCYVRVPDQLACRPGFPAKATIRDHAVQLGVCLVNNGKLVPLSVLLTPQCWSA